MLQRLLLCCLIVSLLPLGTGCRNRLCRNRDDEYDRRRDARDPYAPAPYDYPPSGPSRIIPPRDSGVPTVPSDNVYPPPVIPSSPPSSSFGQPGADPIFDPRLSIPNPTLPRNSRKEPLPSTPELESPLPATPEPKQPASDPNSLLPLLGDPIVPVEVRPAPKVTQKVKPVLQVTIMPEPRPVENVPLSIPSEPESNPPAFKNPLNDPSATSPPEPKVNPLPSTPAPEEKPTPSKTEVAFDIDDPKPIGINGFAVVYRNSLVATGRKPNAIEGFEWLKKSGFKSFLYVHTPGEDLAPMRRLVERHDLTFLSLPLDRNRFASSYQSFVHILEDQTQRPMYIADDRGENVGSLWYVFLKKAEKQNDVDALTRARVYGLNDANPSPEQARLWLAITEFLK